LQSSRKHELLLLDRGKMSVAAINSMGSFAALYGERMGGLISRFP
jgi:hypothetical protein